MLCVESHAVHFILTASNSFIIFRDDPKEEPVFVASNSPGESSAEKIYLCGENLFAAVQ